MQKYLSSHDILNCNVRSKNLTLTAILLAGPSLNVADNLVPYYEFHHNRHFEPRGEDVSEMAQEYAESTAGKQMAIDVHVDFMTRVFETLETLETFEDKVRHRTTHHNIHNVSEISEISKISNQILILAINEGTDHQKKNQNTKDIRSRSFLENPHAFLLHFFGRFCEFMQSVLDQSRLSPILRRFSLGHKGRGSLLLRQMKKVSEIQNPVMETIPEDGLWCSTHLHSFFNWLSEMDREHWFVDEDVDVDDNHHNHHEDHPNHSKILSLIQCCKQMILNYHYQNFLHQLCENYALHKCVQVFSKHPKSMEQMRNVHHNVQIPLKDRLLALSQFQYMISSRLHQLEEEAKATQEPESQYLSKLFEKGMEAHKDSQEYQNLDKAESKNQWKKAVDVNQNTWKKLNNPHFVYDLEQTLDDAEINAWQTF